MPKERRDRARPGWVAVARHRVARLPLLRRLVRRIGSVRQQSRPMPGPVAPPELRRHGGGADDPRFRADSPAALQDAWSYLRAEQVRTRHLEVEARIRERLTSGAPLRVVFVVNERSKWNADGIVDAMLGRGWEVTTALYRMKRPGETPEEARAMYEMERAFFQSLPGTFVDTHDWATETEQPVESLDADVALLQQPWGMENFPRRLTGSALPAYLHYGVPLMANHGMHFNVPGFHPYLWRRYVPSQLHRDVHLEHDSGGFERLRVVGYPRFDAYLEPRPSPHEVGLWRHDGEPSARVIVAPHHSVGPTSLRMATFAWSHRALLDLVDAHPTVSWIYKPHPRLRYALSRAGMMSREDYDEYEARWRRRPNCAVYDGPRYLDLFRTSDGLVTDCGSFLAEYLPTGNPVLRLISQESIRFNTVGEYLRSGFYEVADAAALRSTFDQVLIRREDPLAPRRAELATLFQPGEGSSAEQIVRDLAELSAAPADR